MQYRIIHHLNTKKDNSITNSYWLNIMLKGLIPRYQDSLFIVTLNDQFLIQNLHIFPVKGIDNFKEHISKLLILVSSDQAAYVSIALNIKPKSNKLSRQYQNVLDRSINNKEIPIWTVLHYIDGKYRELQQSVEEDFYE